MLTHDFFVGFFFLESFAMILTFLKFYCASFVCMHFTSLLKACLHLSQIESTLILHIVEVRDECGFNPSIHFKRVRTIGWTHSDRAPYVIDSRDKPHLFHKANGAGYVGFRVTVVVLAASSKKPLESSSKGAFDEESSNKETKEA